MRILVSLLSGGLFSIGLIVSGMINPARVLGFLDVAGGAWDPVLAFVMGGALVPMAVAWRIRAARSHPVLGHGFPAAPGPVDARLVLGGALFGAGWGLVGLCPGPALAGLTLGGWPVLVFVAAMLTGMAVHAFALPGGRPAGIAR